MYEERRPGFASGVLIPLLVKLIFLAIFVFILCFLFLRKNVDNGLTYSENVSNMKETAFEYFTADRLPKKVGDSTKLTLQEMVNQQMLIDFTDNGKKCDLVNSYVQATKTADENYALKVSLVCGEDDDYIVTTIENKENICKSCRPTETETEKSTTNNTQTNTNTSSNTNKNTAQQTNKNTSSSKTSSSSTSKNTTTSKTTTTVTKVTVHYTFTANYGCCNNCNNCNCGNCNNNNCDKTPEVEKEYEVTKPGPWEDGYVEGDENKCEDNSTYKYCRNITNTYYSNCYISESYTKPYSRTFNLSNINPANIYGSVKLISASYFGGLSDYQSYINRNSNIISDASAMQSASLKGNNFTFNTSDIYKENDGYYINVNVNILNKNGVTPYYAPSLGYNIYFIPIKYTVKYTDKNSCVRDTEANSYKYSDYERFDKQTSRTCQHRKIYKKWVSEKELQSYLQDGWSKTGNVRTK